MYNFLRKAMASGSKSQRYTTYKNVKLPLHISVNMAQGRYYKHQCCREHQFCHKVLVPMMFFSSAIVIEIMGMILRMNSLSITKEGIIVHHGSLLM